MRMISLENTIARNEEMLAELNMWLEKKEVPNHRWNLVGFSENIFVDKSNVSFKFYETKWLTFDFNRFYYLIIPLSFNFI